MFVGAYWSQREESKESATARVVAFLKVIGERFDEFTTWYSKARSRSAALQSPLVLDPTTVASKLKVNGRDTDGQPIPELGFDFSAWNGRNVSFSVSIGAYSQHVGNSAVLDIADDDELSRDVLRELLEEMIRAFEPEHAVITSDEHLARSGVTKPWEAGWLTYERGGSVQVHDFGERSD